MKCWWHKWGRVKQWVINGKVILSARCEKCGKLKEDVK